MRPALAMAISAGWILMAIPTKGPLNWLVILDKIVTKISKRQTKLGIE